MKTNAFGLAVFNGSDLTAAPEFAAAAQEYPDIALGNTVSIWASPVKIQVKEGDLPTLFYIFMLS